MRNTMLQIVYIFMLVTMACNTANRLINIQTSTPTQDQTATAEASAIAANTHTASVAQTATMRANVESKQTQVAFQTAQAIIKATDDAIAASKHKTSTAEAIAHSTNEALPMRQRIYALYDEGYISKMHGTFHSLSNFDESGAEKFHISGSLSKYSPTNFVLIADASWDSASISADWYNSGCGIVFRYQDGDNHYLALFALDGYVYFLELVNDDWQRINRGYYGLVERPAGSAEYILIVEGNSFSAFVDGEFVTSGQDTTFSNGKLGFSVVSGTNTGFGIRCRLENIDLWVIED